MEKSPTRRYESPLIEKKYSSASQKHVGSLNPSNHIVQKHNMLLNNLDDPFQNRLNRFQNRNSPSPLNNTRNAQKKNENASIGIAKEKRGFSTQKRIKGLTKDAFELNSNSIKPMSKLEEQDHSSSKFFSTSITFKECVNILHYCRLIYKYIIALRDSSYSEENQIKTFTAWLLTMMDEIKAQISSNGIIYQGQNAWLREKKLKEVANEYQKKYKHELGTKSNIDINLPLLKNYSYSVYEKLDMEISKEKSWNLVVLGHSIVMICDCTHLLKKCYDDKNYKAFGGYK